MKTALIVVMGVSLSAFGVVPMYGQDASDQLRQIECERLRALVDGDLEVAGRLHADDFELITPSGAVWTKDRYLKALASGEHDYRLWEPEAEIDVRHYGDAAVVRYPARVEVTFQGQRQSLRTWHTDVYELRDGEWQVVWSHATKRRSDEP